MDSRKYIGMDVRESRLLASSNAVRVHNPRAREPFTLSIRSTKSIAGMTTGQHEQIAFSGSEPDFRQALRDATQRALGESWFDGSGLMLTGGWPDFFGSPLDFGVTV